jgi:L-rhamnose-H+ transport protein
MPEAAPVGIGLIVLGGIFLGSFTLPMKSAARWPWEAIWLIYSVSGLLIFPLGTAALTLPSLFQIYLQSNAQALLSAALFGFGWGIGSVLFGIGVSRLGMSLGFSIILGVTAALGSLVPMLALTPAALGTVKGVVLLAGLAVILLGIYLCGAASGVKERATSAADSRGGNTLRRGLLICILSGIGAAMLNLAMAFGQDIAARAAALGASASNASNAIWALAVALGSIANVAYCVTLLIRNRSARVFFAPRSAGHWSLGVLMGALWFSGVNVYGRGAAMLGEWGAVMGWPLMMAVMILTANVLGWMTGEWRGTPPRASLLMISGVAVLGMGVLVVGYSGTLLK